MKRNLIKTEKGFTLIELIVVIAIIGILVTILIAAINPAQRIKDANDARRRSDLQALKVALQTYYNDNKNYPSTVTFGSALTNGTTTYMNRVPTDPNASTPYIYNGIGCTGTQCTGYVAEGAITTPNTDDNNTFTACSTAATSHTSTYTYRICPD